MNRKSFYLFLARRLIFSQNNSYSIKIVMWVCCTAIAVGSFALTLIFAIMQGFQTTTEERLQNIHPQIILQAPKGQDLNFVKIKNYLTTESCHETYILNQIAAITPYALSYGVLHNMNLGEEIEFYNVSLIKAIDPQSEPLVSQITTKLEKPMSLADALSKNKIIIGYNLAKSLGLAIDDNAQIFMPDSTNTKPKGINFQKSNVIIGNTIKTGISEFDDSLIITSLNFATKYFPNSGICEIGIKLKPDTDERQVINVLQSKLNLNIFSWKDLYTPLIAALKLEKYVATSIALLVILIAIMTLIALLFMVITKHTSTIVTLKILGLPTYKIHRILILSSLIITSFACLIGMLTATIVGLIIQNYPFIALPDVYYISTLPIRLSTNILLLVFTATLAIAWLAAQIPLNLINNLNLAALLKTKD